MAAIIFITLIGFATLFFITAFYMAENGNTLGVIFIVLGSVLFSVILMFTYHGIKSFL